MTAPYKPDEIERLIRELREDDARMTDMPWQPHMCGYQSDDEACGICSGASDPPGVRCDCDGSYADIMGDQSCDECHHPCSRDDAAAIARTRNNLHALADQLEAARAEIERLTAEQRRVAEIKARIIPSHGRMEAAVRFARAEFRNDGAEGETVHLLADFVDYARYQFLMSTLYTMPVVEAAERYRDHGPVGTGIAAAVDAYRASKP